jgi:hypothetical protein
MTELIAATIHMPSMDLALISLPLQLKTICLLLIRQRFAAGFSYGETKPWADRRKRNALSTLITGF